MIIGLTHAKLDFLGGLVAPEVNEVNDGAFTPRMHGSWRRARRPPSSDMKSLISTRSQARRVRQPDPRRPEGDGGGRRRCLRELGGEPAGQRRRRR